VSDVARVEEIVCPTGVATDEFDSYALELGAEGLMRLVRASD
jgi:hypothetical protein